MNTQTQHFDIKKLSDTSSNPIEATKNVKPCIGLEVTKLLFLKNQLQTTHI